MNLFFQFMATLLVGFAAQWFLPWWWVLAPTAFLAALVFHIPNRLIATLIGLFCGAILWWGMAFYLSTLNHDLLAGRMGRLFGGIGALQMGLMAGLLGGIMGALGALAGNQTRNLFQKQAPEPAN